MSRKGAKATSASNVEPSASELGEYLEDRDFLPSWGRIENLLTFLIGQPPDTGAPTRNALVALKARRLQSVADSHWDDARRHVNGLISLNLVLNWRSYLDHMAFCTLSFISSPV